MGAGQPHQPGHLVGDAGVDLVGQRPLRPSGGALLGVGQPVVHRVVEPGRQQHGHARVAHAALRQLVEAVQDLGQVGQVVVPARGVRPGDDQLVTKGRVAGERPATREGHGDIEPCFAVAARECKGGAMTVGVEDRAPAEAPARREIGVTELDPPRRAPEPDGHPDGAGGHGRRVRRHRRRRLLVGRVLGRRDLRRLHPVPQRGPVGAAAHVPQADAQQPAADAAARAEPAGLPALRGRGRRPLRGEVRGERHGRLPRLRRPQRRPQRARRPSPRYAGWTSTRRAPSATPRARCTPSRASSRWPAT